MQDYKLPENLSLLGCFCNISTGKYEPDISRDEAQYVLWPCTSSNINGISCKHPIFDELVSEMGGLSFENKKISNNIDTTDIPHIIPEGITEQYAWPGMTYVVFSIRDILSSYGKEYAGIYHFPKKFNFTNNHIRFPNQNVKKILSLSGSDAIIETMTSKLGVAGATRAIASLGFDYVIPPDYSAFFGECVGTHRLNQIRSLAFAEDLIANGVQVIPHIFPSNPINLAQYVDWLKKSDTSLVAINAQMHKSHKAQCFLLHVVATVLDACPDLHILIQGGRLNHLVQLGIFLERVHITNRTALQLAKSSTFHKYDVNTDTLRRSTSNEHGSLLVAINIDAYNQKWHNHTIGKKNKINSFESIRLSEFIKAEVV